jgi:hypothetical protein
MIRSYISYLKGLLSLAVVILGMSGAWVYADCSVFTGTAEVSVADSVTVCPPGALPGDPGCGTIQLPFTCQQQAPRQYTCPNGKVAQRQDDCRRCGGGQGNGDKECKACCANGPWAVGGGKLGKAGRASCETVNNC